MKVIFSKIKNFLLKISDFINMIINFVILIPVFFLGVGLTSIISKLFGKHFLDLKLKTKNSYWIKKDLKTQKLEKYYRMF